MTLEETHRPSPKTPAHLKRAYYLGLVAGQNGEPPPDTRGLDIFRRRFVGYGYQHGKQERELE